MIITLWLDLDCGYFRHLFEHPVTYCIDLISIRIKNTEDPRRREDINDLQKSITLNHYNTTYFVEILSTRLYWSIRSFY